MTPANNSNGSFFSFLPCFCIPFQCIGSQDWGTRCPVQLLLPHKVMLLTNILTIAFTSAEDPLSCHHVSNYNLQTCSSYPILGKLCWLKSQVGCICILIKILVQICCDHRRNIKIFFFLALTLWYYRIAPSSYRKLPQLQNQIVLQKILFLYLENNIENRCPDILKQDMGTKNTLCYWSIILDPLQKQSKKIYMCIINIKMVICKITIFYKYFTYIHLLSYNAKHHFIWMSSNPFHANLLFQLV